MEKLKNLQMDEMDTTYVKLWLLLAKNSKAIEQEMEARFHRNFKQSMSRFDVLSQLDRSDPEWLPVGKLAKKLIASKGNITRLVDRMIDEGLIDRRSSPEDRRIIHLGLTTKGRELFVEMAIAHAEWAKSMLDSLDPEHTQQLLALLNELKKTLNVSNTNT
ncbi:MarR family transcriptional regulator [Dasania marina]|uniref:MarR family winged helix-turn-helix transcriptional regulator n=1 Tax=Dasania marina TaxID=471499 RepID=UPI0030D8AFEC|tara:strand:+ start:148221 stop:148703 length:483 start_codon:yes stop_codon:yes gene_type:complete